MDSPKIYVASLSDYNAGRLEGKWFDFDDFSDGEDLMDGITTMLGEIQDKYNDDELREEWAVHDYEGFPSSLYSEYMGEEDFQQIFDIKEASEDVGIPYEVLLERVADTGDEDYQNIADSLFLRVDGYDETDIIYEYEDQIGDLPMSFWQNYLYVDDVTLRTIEYEEESRIKEELMDEGMSEEEAEEEAEEQASDERQRIENDLEGYLEETGYIDGDGNVTIPNWVSKDYQRAWNQGLSYDFDVIHHEDEMFVFSNNYSKGGNITKDYSFGGGVAVGGIVGAYLGYKVGRMRPQKAGFETEKKIGRRIKKEGKKIAGDMTISKKKPQTMAKGGEIPSKIDEGKIVKITREDLFGALGQLVEIEGKTALIDFNDYKNTKHPSLKGVTARRFSINDLEISNDDEYRDYHERVEDINRNRGFNEVWGRFKDRTRKDFGGDKYAEGGEVDYANPIYQYDIRKAKENSKVKNEPFVVVYNPSNDTTEYMSESFWNRTKKTQPKGTRIVFSTNPKFAEGGGINPNDTWEVEGKIVFVYDERDKNDDDYYDYYKDDYVRRYPMSKFKTENDVIKEHIRIFKENFPDRYVIEDETRDKLYISKFNLRSQTDYEDRIRTREAMAYADNERDWGHYVSEAERSGNYAEGGNISYDLSDVI